MAALRFFVGPASIFRDALDHRSDQHMTAMSLSILWLGVIGVGVSVMAVTMLITLIELRRTLRELNTLLPVCRQAVDETHQVLQGLHRMLKHTEGVAKRISVIVDQACDEASAGLEQFVRLAQRVQAFVANPFGHHQGNGHGPRSEPRGRSSS